MPTTSTPKKKPWVTVFGLLVIAALVGAIIAIVPTLFNQKGTSAAADTSTGTAADLKVRPGDLVPGEAKCTSDAFLKNSEPSTALIWSDSVSTPFGSKDPGQMLKEVFAENCENPTVLMMNVEGLSAIKVGDTTIGDVNPWMADFIKQKQSGLVELGFLTKKANSGDSLFVTSSFQETAQLTNTVLLRLKSAGIVNEDSTTNWHVAARDGLAAGKLPVATLNASQEKGREALRLEFKQKTGECLFAIGFNTGDKRLETFDCVKPAPPAPAPSAPAPGTPQPSTPPSTPPSGGCTSNCGGQTPPPCTTDCPKDSRLSVPQPGGVTQQGPDQPQTRPTQPANPAPVQPGNTAPTSGSQAPGATAPDPNRTQPPAGTGTTSGGTSGGVNPSTGSGTNNGTNTGAPPNPFG